MRFRLNTKLIPLFLFAGCTAGGETGDDAQSPQSDRGRAVFGSYCAACHQPDGKGLMGNVPPLDNSTWLTGSEQRLIRIVLHGLRGPIEIDGKNFNREMPGFGLVLSDADIAAVLMHVRRRYGETENVIMQENVQEIRAATGGRTEYWTVEELEGFSE